MAQVSLSQHFCTCCGIAIAGGTEDNTRLCPYCQKSSDERSRQPDAQVEDAEVTIRVAARFVAGLRDEEDGNDDEKTVRASTRLSPRAYALAAQQERHPVPVAELAEQKRSRSVLLKRATHSSRKKPLVLVGCVLGLVLLLALLLFGLAGYGGNPRLAQQVAQSKAQLDSQLSQARAQGVPLALLQPLYRQEQQLASTRLFLPAFFDTGQMLLKGYHALSVRVTSVVEQATEQAQTRAQQDVQNFQVALSQAAVRGAANLDSFSQQFSQDQLALETAKTPGDYAAISQHARQGILALSAMEMALGQLQDFEATISRLRAAGVDVTAMQAQYEDDLAAFTGARHVSDFQNVSALIDAQYQQVVVGSVQAFPYVSVTKLNELQAQVRQLSIYGLDARPYQQRLQADEVMVEQAKTVFDDLLFLRQVDMDIASMHGELVQGEARYLVKEFHQEAAAWAKAHPYYDSYDGHTYALDSGYMQAGIGASIDNDLNGAQTTSDFEAMVAEAQNALFNLHMLEADFNDHTPWNQPHASDLAAIEHYKLQNRTVLMVSLVEQVMRVYRNGRLLRSFYVTTGRAELPSLPGVWATLDRRSPTIFKAADPKGSPYWFPDTPIKYAILYHWGGYFVHDAWWRASFGPGTQFPHQDAGGDTAYNFDGSHGCINLSESDAAWVYQHTDWNTLIVVY